MPNRDQATGPAVAASPAGAASIGTHLQFVAACLHQPRVCQVQGEANAGSDCHPSGKKKNDAIFDDTLSCGMHG